MSAKKQERTATWIPAGTSQMMFGADAVRTSTVFRKLHTREDGTVQAEYWDAPSGGWLPVLLSAEDVRRLPVQDVRSQHFAEDE